MFKRANEILCSAPIRQLTVKSSLKSFQKLKNIHRYGSNDEGKEEGHQALPRVLHNNCFDFLDDNET